jgi:hypothetical protein
MRPMNAADLGKAYHCDEPRRQRDQFVRRPVREIELVVVILDEFREELSQSTTSSGVAATLRSKDSMTSAASDGSA